MATRYIVSDVEACVAFYTEVLGFTLAEKYGTRFAIVERNGDVLWLSGPGSSAAKSTLLGEVPSPGGWNRVVVQVEDFVSTVDRLRANGAVFRGEPVSGVGGVQVLIEDPSGNPVEVFCPRA